MSFSHDRASIPPFHPHHPLLSISLSVSVFVTYTTAPRHSPLVLFFAPLIGKYASSLSLFLCALPRGILSRPSRATLSLLGSVAHPSRRAFSQQSHPSFSCSLRLSLSPTLRRTPTNSLTLSKQGRVQHARVALNARARVCVCVSDARNDGASSFRRFAERHTRDRSLSLFLLRSPSFLLSLISRSRMLVRDTHIDTAFDNFARVLCWCTVASTA